MGHDEIRALPLTELCTRLQRRELTAVAVVEACLARIAEREPHIHAWTVVDATGALAEARLLDAGDIRGPLHGVPIGIKDIIDTGDLPTAYGSSIYAGHVPAHDAVCVAAARRAGAVIVGKTVATEFATFRAAATVNPRDPSRTPGGSSSGSAAAVADRMVPLTFGTQTMGSIVRPASYCGVVGFKPTFGTIPVDGVKLIAPSLDTVGVFADSVEAAALFAGAVTGRADLLRLPATRGRLRIGLCRTHEWPAALPETRDAMTAAAANLAAAGARVATVDLPPEFATLWPHNEALYGYELARSLAAEYAAHRAQLGTDLVAAIAAGRRISTARYREAMAATEACRTAFADALHGCDVLLTPSAPGQAPAGLHSTGSPVMNRLWTLLGVPAVGIPAAHSPAGLPVGLQIIGRRNDDPQTLAAAAWILHALTRSAEHAPRPPAVT